VFLFLKTLLLSFKYSTSPTKKDLINKFFLVKKRSMFFLNVMTKRAIDNNDPHKRAA